MRNFALFVAGAAALLLGACTTNIEGDPRYETGFREGQIYVLTQGVHGVLTRHFGNVSGINLVSSPEYENQLASEHREWVSIEPGTELLVRKVVLYHTGDGAELTVDAEFASGIYKGKHAGLRDISRQMRSPRGGMFDIFYARDPTYLSEKVLPTEHPTPTGSRY